MWHIIAETPGNVFNTIKQNWFIKFTEIFTHMLQVETHVHIDVLPLPTSLICIFREHKIIAKNFWLKMKGVMHSQLYMKFISFQLIQFREYMCLSGGKLSLNVFPLLWNCPFIKWKNTKLDIYKAENSCLYYKWIALFFYSFVVDSADLSIP